MSFAGRPVIPAATGDPETRGHIVPDLPGLGSAAPRLLRDALDGMRVEAGQSRSVP